jgi:hypothetical protein
MNLKQRNVFEGVSDSEFLHSESAQLSNWIDYVVRSLCVTSTLLCSPYFLNFLLSLKMNRIKTVNKKFKTDLQCDML